MKMVKKYNNLIAINLRSKKNRNNFLSNINLAA